MTPAVLLLISKTCGGLHEKRQTPVKPAKVSRTNLLLQTLVAVRIGVLFGLLFLGEMALVVRSDLPHMCHIVVVILRRILLGILLQNFNDLPSTIQVVSRRPLVLYW